MSSMDAFGERKKRYVTVTTRTDEDGTIHPMSVLWWDGKTYAFDEVSKPRPRSSRHVGGDGLCYTVRIGKTITELFYEGPRWFVEERVTPEGI